MSLALTVAAPATSVGAGSGVDGKVGVISAAAAGTVAVNVEVDPAADIAATVTTGAGVAA